MNRFFALIGALLLAFISVSSACTAAPAGLFHFTLEPDHGSDRIKASFRRENRPDHDNNWSTGFRPETTNCWVSIRWMVLSFAIPKCWDIICGKQREFRCKPINRRA